jgi:hypothetical protein
MLRLPTLAALALLGAAALTPAEARPFAPGLSAPGPAIEQIGGRWDDRRGWRDDRHGGRWDDRRGWRDDRRGSWDGHRYRGWQPGPPPWARGHGPPPRHYGWAPPPPRYHYAPRPRAEFGFRF